MCSIIADHAAHVCSWYTTSELCLGMLWGARSFWTPGKNTKCLGDDQQFWLNLMWVRRAEMGSPGALFWSPCEWWCALQGAVRWLGGKHSLSITSSPFWNRPRMHHRGCGVWHGPTVYMTLLPSKVSFKDVADCTARLWNYREGTM